MNSSDGKGKMDVFLSLGIPTMTTASYKLSNDSGGMSLDESKRVVVVGGGGSNNNDGGSGSGGDDDWSGECSALSDDGGKEDDDGDIVGETTTTTTLGVVHKSESDTTLARSTRSSSVTGRSSGATAMSGVMKTRLALIPSVDTRWKVSNTFMDGLNAQRYCVGKHDVLTAGSVVVLEWHREHVPIKLQVETAREVAQMVRGEEDVMNRVGSLKGVYFGKERISFVYMVDDLEEWQPLRVILPFLSNRERMEITFQIMEGMAYLHEQGMFHGSLGLDSILVCKVNETRIQAVIVGYGIVGLTRTLATAREGAFMEDTSPSILRWGDGTHDGRRGADAYALGVLLYQLLDGAPFAPGSMVERALVAVNGGEVEYVKNASDKFSKPVRHALDMLIGVGDAPVKVGKLLKAMRRIEKWFK